MAKSVLAEVLVLVLVVSILPVAATNTTDCNATIKALQDEIKALKAKNLKLEAEKHKLELQLQEAKNWDVRALMDELFMYTTIGGKQYKLLFHVGGLGGVVVYQYVGFGLGDAGQFRQYKQIAFLKTERGKSGFLQPVVVLRPVWSIGNKTEIKVRTIADIIRLEEEYNSIKGLAAYYEWMFNKYTQSSTLAGVSAFTIGVFLFCVGLVVGEKVRVFGRILDYITLRRVTGFKIGKKR